MYGYDTGGNLIPAFIPCGVCFQDTGGNHQSWCPCKPKDSSILRMDKDLTFLRMTEQGQREIEEGKFVRP